MISPTKREQVQIGKWLLDGNTGLSSLALASFFLTSGNKGESASRLPAPSDPADFNRCINFLKICLSSEARRLSLISEIGEMTDNWKKVKSNWVELVTFWEKENKFTSSPELFAFMKKIGL